MRDIDKVYRPPVVLELPSQILLITVGFVQDLMRFCDNPPLISRILPVQTR